MSITSAEIEILDSIAASPRVFGQFPGEALMELPPVDEIRESLLKRQQAYFEDIENQAASAKRVDKLRSLMKKKGIDYFLVPIRDRFFGEYIPMSAQRLCWLTGFTGSNGFVVVGIDEALFLTDGRYTLQMKEQLDDRIFQLGHLVEQPMETWLQPRLKKGQVLAYDPWLHSRAEYEKYQELCDKYEVTLHALENNLVDEIWDEQPPLPLSPLVRQPLQYTGKNSLEKCKDIACSLNEKGLDMVVLSQSDSIGWLLNIRAWDVPNTPFVLSYAILHADGHVDWYLDLRKLQGLELETHIQAKPFESFESDLAEISAGSRVLLNKNASPVALYQLLANNSVDCHFGDDPCQLPKAIKTAEEIKGIQDAHLLDAVAMCRFLDWFSKLDIHSQPDEIQLAGQLQAYRQMNPQCLALSFDTISGAGGNGAIVHYRVDEKSNRKLAANELYLVDSGGQYPGGTTDITRTMVLGVPTQQQKEHFTLVLKGHIALSDVRFPAGTAGAQLDVLARAALWQRGLDYDHGTGHGVGAFLSVHEGPQGIGKGRSDVPLKAGMILSNEPGYYLEGQYGIRIENLVLVIEDKRENDEREMLAFEPLTWVPIDRRLVEESMLSSREREWLNEYHRLVFDKVADLLPDESKAWLEQACKPI